MYPTTRSRGQLKLTEEVAAKTGPFTTEFESLEQEISAACPFRTFSVPHQTGRISAPNWSVPMPPTLSQNSDIFRDRKLFKYYLFEFHLSYHPETHSIRPSLTRWHKENVRSLKDDPHLLWQFYYIHYILCHYAEAMLHVEGKAKIALAEFEKSIRWPGMTVEEALLEASVELHKLYRQGMKELGDVAVQWGKAVYDVWSSEDADKKIVAWYKQFMDGLGG